MRSTEGHLNCFRMTRDIIFLFYKIIEGNETNFDFIEESAKYGNETNNKDLNIWTIKRSKTLH